jgi:hypothetical protein
MQILSRYTLIVNVSMLLIMLGTVLLVASAPNDITFDRGQYAAFFNISSVGYWYEKYEPGFSLLTLLISSFVSDSWWYFFVLCSMLLVFHQMLLNAVRDALGVKSRKFLGFYFFALLGSSWFVVASINGLRQGLAIPLLYLGVFYLWRHYYCRSFFVLSFAASMHISVVLFIPFFVMLFLGLRTVVCIFASFAVLYVLGLSGGLLQLFDSVFPVSLYELLMAYGEMGAVKYVGFVPSHYAYTLGYLLLFLFARSYLLEDKVVVNVYDALLKIFMLASSAYFLFGIGAFSNRFGIVAWALIPLLQTFILAYVRVSIRVKIIFAFSFASFAVIHYLSYVT